MVLFYFYSHNGDEKFEQTVENDRKCHTINRLDSLKIINLEIIKIRCSSLTHAIYEHSPT